MEFMAWIFILIAGAIGVAFFGIGLVILALVCLTIGIPAAFLSGHPFWGLTFILIDWAIVSYIQQEGK